MDEYKKKHVKAAKESKKEEKVATKPAPAPKK